MGFAFNRLLKDADTKLKMHSVHITEEQTNRLTNEEIPRQVTTAGERQKTQYHGWDFSGYSWISGFRCLSESNKNGTEMPFECDLSPCRIETLILSHLYIIQRSRISKMQKEDKVHTLHQWM